MGGGFGGLVANVVAVVAVAAAVVLVAVAVVVMIITAAARQWAATVTGSLMQVTNLVDAADRADPELYWWR